MDAAVPILSYTELPPGANIGFERTADGCTIRFRTLWACRPEPIRPPTRAQVVWATAALAAGAGLVLLVNAAFDVPLADAMRLFGEVLAAVAVGVVALMGPAVLFVVFVRDLSPRVRLTVTRTHLTLHARRADMSLISYRVGQIARVDAINGRLSIRLLDGRGWLDGEGVGSFYFDTAIRPDELTWLVRTLREELGLAARDSSAGVAGIMRHDVPGERP